MISLNKVSLIGVVFFFLLTSMVYGQEINKVEVIVTDMNLVPIENASVQISNENHSDFQLSDHKGKAVFTLKKGNYDLTIFHISYQTVSHSLNITSSQTFSVKLPLGDNTLEEVVITAEEGKGLVTKSVINRKAMEHLQPSSFADLMELLPGGVSKTPNLTSTNKILIREFGKSGYNTSSLGVQFVMDGNILNTNADMLVSVDADQGVGSHFNVAANRQTNSIGVDMRTLSTNDIESVEVIRGIPSASYGDLTSGLVLINRKSGHTDWQARLKVDGYSKQYYIAKGLSLSPTWDLNVSFDLLDAKSDPRDIYETYKRITSSIRSKKQFNFQNNHSLTWKSNLDLNGNIDDVKVDPDDDVVDVDRYKNNRYTLSFSNNFDYVFNRESLFKNIELKTSVRQGFEDLKQTKFVQMPGATVISTAFEQGVNDGYFPELSYISYLHTESKPLDINTKLQANLDFKIAEINNDIEFGIDYKYSKNNGRGQMYDLLKPPTATTRTRPRAFKDIPAFQNIAFFAGDRIQYRISDHRLALYGGVRISKMLGVNDSYAISKKVYVEPRVNFQWSLPNLKLGSDFLKTDVTLGYGELYKQPTLMMLYPNKSYLDFQQLNYYHPNEAYRYVNFMTYVQDKTNYDLLAAKNTKKEVRFDFSYKGHSAFITYFDEKMPTGFRNMSAYNSYDYKRYDTSGIDHQTVTSKPDINELPYEERTTWDVIGMNQNGSSTYKRGIEFGYNSPRFESIGTRFTLSGAWFKTIYENTKYIEWKPTMSINGGNIPYVGIYANDEGYDKGGMRFNLVIDTYVKSLDMSVSLSLQGELYLNDRRAFKSDTPIYYKDYEGNIFDYTQADRTDIYKQWLIRPVSSTDNLDFKYGYDLTSNLKVTKKIFDKVKVSFFVNNIYTKIRPYYYLGDTKINLRAYSTPYFGMEMTYNF